MNDRQIEKPSKAIARQLRELRAEMRQLGIKKTSCFNGGMDRETRRYNERRFALETNLADAKRRETEATP